MIGRLILIIEDDEFVREIAQTCFELADGWRVISASSSHEGLWLADRERPDVILLDVMMPDVSGPETLRRLRANPRLSAIPVVFFTAKTQPADVEELRALGALGVITKPFDPERIADQIREMMGWQHDQA
jgi:CheY-like chemotaxis protein